MGQLVFQATAGGQVALVGPNPSTNFSLNVPAVNGNLVTTGDTGTVTNTMLASSAYTAPGTIGSGTPNTGKFTSITNTGLTATQVIYATTGGLETSSANMTFDGTKLTLANDASISGLTVGKGGGSVSTNTVLGASAMVATATGANNTAIGNNALNALTSGAENTAIGAAALGSNTTGGFNTAIGRVALNSNSTGGSNTALGYYALVNNTTASNNTAVGYQAAYSNTTGANLTAVGYKALYASTGDNNTAFGWNAGVATTSGSGNYFSGNQAGVSNTTGSNNSFAGGLTAAGVAVGNNNTTGSFNTAFGSGALTSNTTASNNTAVGYQAGYSNSVGTEITLFGYKAGYATTGNYNTYVGSQTGITNTSGTNNTAVGWGAGSSVATGSYNTCFGYGAGSNLINSASKNTIIGCFNGNQGGLNIATASNYIVLSDGDGNPRGVFDNNGRFFVGATASYGSTFSTYQYAGATYNGIGVVQSDNASGGRFMLFSANNAQCGVIDRVGTTSAVVYTATSDQRLKENIVDAPSAMDYLSAVKVRSYNWIDGGHKVKYGVIAQEFVNVEPDAVVQGDTGETIEKTWSVDTSVLVPAMIKAIQELKAEVDQLKAK